MEQAVSRSLPPESGTETLLTMARAMLELDRQAFDARDAPLRQPAHMQELARLVRELADGLGGDLRRFAQLEVELRPSCLVQRLLELPLQLSDAGYVEPALSVARSFAFIAPDTLRGDEALILARAGQRSEALALVAANLAQAKDIPSAEAKAGDAFRALGEADAAEAYYLRSLAVSKTAGERSEAVLRLVSLLSDTGRADDASALLRDEQHRVTARALVESAKSQGKVRRNQPCPCGSGKKYKHCHGAAE